MAVVTLITDEKGRIQREKNIQLAQTNGLDFGLLYQLVKSQRVNNMEMGFNDIAKQCLLAHGYDYNAPEERFLILILH